MALRSNKPRALVTGCDGFTGRHICQALDLAGFDVVGLSRTGTGLEHCGQVLQADLLDPAAVRHVVDEARADVVLHLAAVAYVDHGDADAIYRVNIVGTRNLLQALAAAPATPSKVVLASSANIYGNAKDDPITERTPVAPANDYAVSKLAMEHMAGLWCGQLPIVITRPFNYTGTGQSDRFLVAKIVSHFRRGARRIELGNIDVYRDFSDVRDVARVYVKLATDAPAGTVVNICSGKVHSLRAILTMMADVAGYEIEVSINPKFVRRNEVKRLVGSYARLQSLVGIHPTIPLRETLEWMHEAGNQPDI